MLYLTPCKCEVSYVLREESWMSFLVSFWLFCLFVLETIVQCMYSFL